MKSPTINFRLSKYHLARGLQIIRNFEPNYQLTSLTDIVKSVYFDYLAKMTLGTSDQIPSSLMLEIEAFIQDKKEAKSLTLESFLDQVKDIPEPKLESSSNNDKSQISSVSDFSPPNEWDEE